MALESGVESGHPAPGPTSRFPDSTAERYIKVNFIIQTDHIGSSLVNSIIIDVPSNRLSKNDINIGWFNINRSPSVNCD